MHAIKCGWVGQTFALAKSNESERRKSRIRRSKGERKAMVESFIKKYQKLNNGSFPSLNLTHKEVGGSFYTVREIVRDIIQENRVLGPAKLTQEKQSTHQLVEEPLGSIALEPAYISTDLSNGSELVTSEYQRSDEPSLVSHVYQATPEDQIFGNGKIINGTPVDPEIYGHGELKYAEMLEVVELVQNDAGDEVDKDKDLDSDGNYASPEPMNGSLADMRTKESHEVKNEGWCELTQKEIKVNEASEAESVEEVKVTPITGEVKVEAFPMKPVTMTDGLDGRLSEVNDMANTFSEQGTEKVELFTGVVSSQTDVHFSQDKKVLTNVSDPPLDKHSGLVDEEVAEEQLDPLLKSSNCSNEDIGHEIHDSTSVKTKISSNDLTSVTSEHGVAIAGAKMVNTPIGVKTKHMGHSNGMIGQSKIEEELIEKENNVQLRGKPQKESNTTFDRINLESWDGASGKPRPENNPIWAVFKAFIDAFMKFWTE